MTDTTADPTTTEYGSVQPGLTKPDVFYPTAQEAIWDCAMGTCRVVFRTSPDAAWQPLLNSPDQPVPVGVPHMPTTEQRLATVQALFDDTFGTPDEGITEATINVADFWAALQGWNCPSGCLIVHPAEDPTCPVHGVSPGQ